RITISSGEYVNCKKPVTPCLGNIKSIYRMYPIKERNRLSSLLLRNSFLYVAQKVMNIGISPSPCIHLRIAVNILIVAVKEAKIIIPTNEKAIHKTFI